MSDTTLPVAQPPQTTQTIEWEGGSEKPKMHIPLPNTANLQWSISRKFNRLLPPDRTYLRLKRRTFLIVVAVALVCILALAIGLGVGLGGGSSSSGSEDLPLPTDTKKHTGDLTYYEPGLGACGITSTSSDSIVAISELTFDAVQVGSNPNANPLCGLMIRATRYNEAVGEERSVDLKVVDRCTGCQPSDIDTTTSVFQELAAIEDGRVPVTWAWLDPIPSMAA